jgi:glutamate-5-semialdehyde dehydrogenase
MSSVREAAASAALAGRTLVAAGAPARDALLRAAASALERPATRTGVLAANAADLSRARPEAARLGPAGDALLKRLTLSEARLAELAAGLRQLAAQPDPVGRVTVRRELDEGLLLTRETCPLGLLAVVFEARPDALIQIAGLALRSGNAVILKGGSEAHDTNRFLAGVLHETLSSVGQSPSLATLLEDRSDVKAVIQLDDLVDLVIARGSGAFVRQIRAESRVPVMAHAEGLCHVYLHAAAEPAMAARIAVDAKTSYPAACNSVETLLWDAANLAALDATLVALTAAGVEIRGCPATRARHPEVRPASADDWDTEYGALILSVRQVAGIEEALAHISAHGSGHTEAIVTGDPAAAERFLAEVDAACVFHNASTRFADGYRFGLGAEVGISTDKLHARGPVGIEGLLTYRWILRGHGQISATYGVAGRPFTHRDL